MNTCPRAVARSENPGGLVALGGDNVSPLVQIGLTDLPKTGGAKAHPTSPLPTGLYIMYERTFTLIRQSANPTIYSTDHNTASLAIG